MKTRTSWRDKMENPNLPKVVEIPRNWRKRFGNGSMVIPHPRDVEAVMRGVPRGRLITVGQIREMLAGKYEVETACPLTTGMFIRIAAEAANEEEPAEKRRITPYWRVVRDDGSLNPKFPGGVEAQAERLRDEGWEIVGGGRAPKVKGFGLCKTTKTSSTENSRSRAAKIGSR